jgi:hypothetical protein
MQKQRKPANKTKRKVNAEYRYRKQQQQHSHPAQHHEERNQDLWKRFYETGGMR